MFGRTNSQWHDETIPVAECKTAEEVRARYASIKKPTRTPVINIAALMNRITALESDLSAERRKSSELASDLKYWKERAALYGDDGDKPITVNRIMGIVGDYYGIAKNELISQRRNIRVVRPRQVVMFLAKELTQSSLPTIGKILGGRDHTTVLNGIRRIRIIADLDEKLAADLEEIRRRVARPV